jgi:hypothetical protein
MPRREYFVIDGTGHVSYTALRGEFQPEAFTDIRKARRRAERLARDEPGHTVVITESVAWVTCEVGEPKIEVRMRKVRK